MSSHWGNHLHLSVFGQSHGPAIGVTVDGLPAGFPIDREALSAFLARRGPGRSHLTTPRGERDEVQFLSGLKGDVTCGAPLAAVIENRDTRSGDYAQLSDLPRPGHADWTAQIKYKGYQDVAGGGHFSGRLTAPLCIAGGICRQMLGSCGISVYAHLLGVGAVSDRVFDPMGETGLERLEAMPLPTLETSAAAHMERVIVAAHQAGDSVGGVVECMVQGFPAGLGGALFGGLESRLASILFAVPGVKGVEFGAGFSAARMTGGEHNDSFVAEGGQVKTASNRHGGILGGISTGMPLVLRAAFKPTPSIAKPQDSVRLSTGEAEQLHLRGRHDPCIAVRAVPVVEAAAAIALMDVWLEENGRGVWI